MVLQPRMRHPIRFVLAATIFAVGTAVPASAEIVYLTSGKTISVKAHRIDGDFIVMTLRGGGEVTC
jgi:hypothetical protein